MANPHSEDVHDDWTKLKGKLRDDPKGNYILYDPTIVTWGKNLLKKLGYNQERYIRDRMRTVATFCLKYIEIEGSDDYFIKDILRPKNFRKICSVAKAAWNESLTPATKLGRYLKEIVVVLQNAAIMENDNSSKIHYENLLQLIDTSWTYVSAPNRRKLNEQKDHVVEMPITNDIKLFLHYVSIEISQKITEFDQNENDYVLFHDFTKLNKLVLAYIIVFNRRREGEVS